MKKLAYMLTGLALLANIALAQNLEFYIKRNGDIIMVRNKKTAVQTYVGDTFCHYRKEDDKWILYKMTYLGKGHNKREFVRQVNEEEIPTYIKGFYSLYYDSDQNEENLVTVWDDNIDSKVQDEWIEKAKNHIKELNSS